MYYIIYYIYIYYLHIKLCITYIIYIYMDLSVRNPVLGLITNHLIPCYTYLGGPSCGNMESFCSICSGPRRFVWNDLAELHTLL